MSYQTRLNIVEIRSLLVELFPFFDLILMKLCNEFDYCPNLLFPFLHLEYDLFGIHYHLRIGTQLHWVSLYYKMKTFFEKFDFGEFMTGLR